MIVTMFPQPREQAKAIGVYSFVASARSVDRPAGRRRAHPDDQLALDLLREPADRHRHARPRQAADREGRGHRAQSRSRRARRGADHRRADARPSTRSSRRATTAGARCTRSASARCPSGCWRASSSGRPRRRNPLMPLRVFRSRNVWAANLIQTLMVAGMFGMFFLGRALPAARARLRPDRGRPGVPAGVGRHRRAVARLLRAADHCASAGGHADPGTGADHRRARAVRAHAGRRATTGWTCCPPMLLLGIGAGDGASRP